MVAECGKAGDLPHRHDEVSERVRGEKSALKLNPTARKFGG
ncbi:hypothetical protein [Geomicrobium sp. JCM 19039]|nr:hypothetical protein [Geomicrobium sp. JCM 19039]